jgi:HEPN domain
MAKKRTPTPAESLARAKRQLKRASENASDPDEVFLWGFYALENAVVAAARHADAEFQKNHWTKAAAARRLEQQHSLPDVSDLLSDLNEARKGTAYGDVEESELDPEEVLLAITEYVDTVEAFLKKKIGK